MQSINGEDGTMSLQVSFDVATDVDIDQVQVQNRLAQAQSSVPAEVSSYGLTTQQTVGIPLMVFAVTSPKRTWDQTFLANYVAINIEDELARIPGIGQVKVFGASSYAMRIWVTPDTLAKLQLTVADLENAIAAQNVVNPAGTIGGEPAPPGQQETYTVRAKGRLLNAEEFGNIILRSNPDGSLGRLKDVSRMLVGAFMFFPAVGFSVNTLSLLGLVLAVGLVVDDAIVVVEAIEAKIDQGLSPRDAAVEAMDEVGGALIGIALVLSAVFIPAGFMAGIPGSLYKQFALTIAFSVIISAFNALTLSPALGALLLRPRPTEESRGPLPRFFRLFNAGFSRAQKGYVTVSNLLIRRFVLALVVLIGFTMLPGGIGRVLPRSFLPDEDQGYFIINVQLPEATSLQRTVQLMKKIEVILKNEPGVRYSNAIAGYSVLAQTTSTRSGTYFCLLQPFDRRKTPTMQAGGVVSRLKRQLGGRVGAQGFWFFPPGGSGVWAGGGGVFFITAGAGEEGQCPARKTPR